MSKKNIVTRFAPSPTGFFHIGSARTALFNYLFAKQEAGTFLLRIEDTDPVRSKKEYEEDIMAGLAWLALAPDEILWQSKRGDVYKKYIGRLLAGNHAYTSSEEGERKEVIKFKNPNKTITFTDIVHGEITFDTSELGDFIIARSETEPLYHLAVVIDDIESRITHVIRGEDGVSNTPRQMLLIEALGASPPAYAHIPFILAPDKSKLSKRHGAVAITQYKDEGFLPEACINYMALLGWHPKDNKELFTIDELLEHFSLERVQKGGAIFDREKLLWFNREYLRKKNPSEFKTIIMPHLPENIRGLKDRPQFGAILALIHERISSPKELLEEEYLDSLSFITATPSYHTELLVDPKTQPPPKTVAKHLSFIRTTLAGMSDSDFSSERIRNALWDYAERQGRGQVLWPLRVALTGREKSPDPFVAAYIVGKKETLARLETAQKRLQ